MQSNLIQEQLQLAKCAAKENAKFGNLKDITDLLENGLKKVFYDWQRESKATLSHLETQLKLKSKYDELNRDSKLIKEFEAESKREWQWTDSYLSSAVPIEDLAEDAAWMSEEPYKVNVAFAQMRKRHAAECMQFVTLHQAKMLELYRQKSNKDLLQQQLKTKVSEYVAMNPTSLDDNFDINNLIKQYTDIFFRNEMPKITNRLDADKKKKDKREAALREAQAKFDSLSTKSLVTLLAASDKLRPE